MRKKAHRKATLNAKLLHDLNENIAKLGKSLHAINNRVTDEDGRGGFRAFWSSLMAGLARGVGMVVGASFMTAIGLAVLYAAFYWLLHYLNMIPLVSDMAGRLSDLFHQFVQREPGGP